MTTVTIDSKQYQLADMSEAARNQLKMLQLVDAEIQRLTVQLAIAQTARVAYGQELNAALPK